MFQQVEDTVEVRKLNEEQLKAQINDLNSKLEKYKMLESYAQDAVKLWPTITLRTMWKMVRAMDDIKEALGFIK